MRYLYILILLFVLNASAQESKIFSQTQIPYNPETYLCYKTSSDIIIDGHLDEDAWKRAIWTKEFVDIEGSLRPVPTFKTNVKMLWDDTNFYVAAYLEEPHIWAKLTERDAVIYYDNDFELFIDPDADTHDYFELEINALETEWDLLLTKPYRDGASAIHSFDFKDLSCAVSVQGTLNDPIDMDSSWTIEIAIPWQSFKDCANRKLPPADKDQWRINFSRVEWQTEISDGEYVKKINPETGKNYPENNWVWSPQGLIAMHAPETWGIVQFSELEAGEGETEFIRARDEEARWALRRLYYNERTFQMNHGKFTEDMKKLNMAKTKLNNYNWPPVLKITPSLFEAVLLSKDGKEKWHIIQDGKIWKKNYD